MLAIYLECIVLLSSAMLGSLPNLTFHRKVEPILQLIFLLAMFFLWEGFKDNEVMLIPCQFWLISLLRHFNLLNTENFRPFSSFLTLFLFAIVWAPLIVLNVQNWQSILGWQILYCISTFSDFFAAWYGSRKYKSGFKIALQEPKKNLQNKQPNQKESADENSNLLEMKKKKMNVKIENLEMKKEKES